MRRMSEACLNQCYCQDRRIDQFTQTVDGRCGQCGKEGKHTSARIKQEKLLPEEENPKNDSIKQYQHNKRQYQMQIRGKVMFFPIGHDH